MTRRLVLWAAVAIAALAGASAASAAGQTRLLHVTLHPTPDARHAALAVSVRVAERDAEVQVRVNGKRVDAALHLVDQRRFAGQISASHGLRYGHNRLVISARWRDGRRDRVVRTVNVPRGAPLAGAGRDRRVAFGRTVRLDGRDSLASRKGDQLVYRWRIAERPRGSRARLRGARTARPRLVPDVPGRYRVALHVAERPARAKAAQAVPVDPPITPVDPPITPVEPPITPVTPPLTPVTPFDGTVPLDPPFSVLNEPQPTTAESTALVTVTIPAPVPPIGYPISTIPASGTGITVNGTTYTPTSDFVQALLLKRTTMKPSGHWNIHTGDPGRLTSLLTSAGADQYVILTGGGRAVDPDGPFADVVRKAVTRLGGDASLTPASAISSGQWSVAGVPGSGKGSAVQTFGLASTPGGVPGDLRARVRQDYNHNAVILADDPVPVTTQVLPESETTNRILVDKTTYDSTTIPQSSAGFQVLGLDQGTLALVDNETFVTNLPGDQPNDPAIEAMGAALRRLQSREGTLVIVQSVGSPLPRSTAWLTALRDPMVALGATGDVFTGLNGHGGYALIGGTDLPFGAAAEQSKPLTGNSGRISGQLVRNQRWQYVPGNNAYFDILGVDMNQIAFQDLVPWPESDTPGKIRANAWIAHQLGLAYNDVRDSYLDVSEVWSAVGTQLKNLQYPGATTPADTVTPAPPPIDPVTPPIDPVTPPIDPVTPPSATVTPAARAARARQAPTPVTPVPPVTPVTPVPPPTPVTPVTPSTPVTPTKPKQDPAPKPNFTEAEFLAVKGQLLKEFPMVAEVRGLFNTYQTGIFTEAENSSLVNLRHIADRVKTTVDPPRKPTKLDIAAIIEDALRIGATVFGPIPNIGAVGVGTLNALSAALNLAMSITYTKGGTTIRQQIDGDADELAYQINQIYATILDSMGMAADLMVSDWGKLNAASKAAVGRWALTGTAEQQTRNALTLTASQLFYTRLLSISYKHYTLELGGPDVRSGLPANDWIRCGPNKGSVPFPFIGVAPDAQYQSLRGFDAQGRPITGPEALAPKTVDLHPDYPWLPEKLAHNLFESPLAGGIGFHRPWMFAQMGATVSVSPNPSDC